MTLPPSSGGFDAETKPENTPDSPTVSPAPRQPTTPSVLSPVNKATTAAPIDISRLSIAHEDQDSPSPPATSSPPDPPAAPDNSPNDNLDSGIASPSDYNTARRASEPIVIKRYFFGPPSNPPNTPDSVFGSYHLQRNFGRQGMGMDGTDESFSDDLSGRLEALRLVRSREGRDTMGKGGAQDSEPSDTEPQAPDESSAIYEVRAIPGKGYGCFAIRYIERGTRILEDTPLLIVPIAFYLQKDIQAAFNDLTPTEKALYFTLHSAHNQDPGNWPRAIHPNVTGDERTRIQEQHNARIGKEPSLISIFQTNCMEMGNGAAVFVHASRFNHSCNPNANFTWNHQIEKETIHAIKDIKAGEQITLSYCDMTHDKATRRWELNHYGFVCDCPACTDDDDPNSFASMSANRRYRIMELQHETHNFRFENLEDGAKKKGFVSQLLEYVKLLKEEGDYSVRLASAYLDVALISEKNGDFEYAKRAAVKAHEVMLHCHGDDYPGVAKYAGVVGRILQKFQDAKEKRMGMNGK
ncbi:SET domain-containing protein [Lojkania enalia]|uniref:SET domain-containing protein n=1 Tax=Lojkania enalia TaxID=147567 RepID=A0A9P4NAP8_9PLEO|nr:SET domain-containing protein [Didymosphaeria enalia]